MADVKFQVMSTVEKYEDLSESKGVPVGCLHMSAPVQHAAEDRFTSSGSAVDLNPEGPFPLVSRPNLSQ